MLRHPVGTLHLINEIMSIITFIIMASYLRIFSAYLVVLLLLLLLFYVCVCVFVCVCSFFLYCRGLKTHGDQSIGHLVDINRRKSI